MTLIYTVLASCNPTVADLDLLVNSTHYRILREASNRSSHPIPIHPIASHPIASHPIPSHPIPSHPISSHPIPPLHLRTTYYVLLRMIRDLKSRYFKKIFQLFRVVTTNHSLQLGELHTTDTLFISFPGEGVIVNHAYGTDNQRASATYVSATRTHA